MSVRLHLRRVEVPRLLRAHAPVVVAVRDGGDGLGGAARVSNGVLCPDIHSCPTRVLLAHLPLTCSCVLSRAAHMLLCTLTCLSHAPVHSHLPLTCSCAPPHNGPACTKHTLSISSCARSFASHIML